MKSKKNKVHSPSRRKFLQGAAATTAGVMIVPRHVIGGPGYKAPSDTLNIAGVGVGGMGHNNLNNMATENIVALCDTYWDYAKKSFDKYPKAKQFKDYRVMLDQMGKDIDAVMVATPDHTHALVAVDSMLLGKHVYVQKPLTHSVYESRTLRLVAKRMGVATQMGNQGNSGDGIRQICEWIWNGEIGEVKEVHAWTNRPVWPQGMNKPTGKAKIPKSLDWDLFIGPAQYRDFHPLYQPWNWRGWWDYGTGALGDMACHIMDPAFKAMRFGHPYAVEATSTEFNIHSAPQSEVVTYYFPARDNLPKVAFPEATFTWYDGGIMPPRPAELEQGKQMGDGGGGVLFVGSKGKLICSTYARNPYIIGREEVNVPQTLRRVKDGIGGHEQDWIRACKEPKETRIEASSNFDYAGPLNEVVVMGNLGVRLQGLQKRLLWDGENMRFTNINDNEEITAITNNVFTMENDKPQFNRDRITLNAKQLAEELVKHNYREGWKLSE